MYTASGFKLAYNDPPRRQYFLRINMLPKLYWRVYLQQGNYPAARDAAHDVIENSDVLYPLNMQILLTMMSIKSRIF
jgi:hypothetical protein